MRATAVESATGYLSLKGLSTYSGLSVRTLRGYLTSAIRPLPHYRVGGKILVSRPEFDQWVKQFRVRAATTAASALVDDVMTDLQ